MPAVIALLFVLDVVAVAGVFKTDDATNCGADPGWECSHAWEQFFFIASIVLLVLLVAACFVWLIQWAEYGRRRIYGERAPDHRRERERAQREDRREIQQDRITRRAWRGNQPPD